MQPVTRWKMVVSACLTAALLTGAARAEDKKPAAKALDRHALDESIYQSLRAIIDHGATLYNDGDWNGCYRLWEGALMSLKPLLDHRPKLQESIDGGLAKARQDPVLWHRAWVLRPVLDKIRSDINADYPHRKKLPEGSPLAKSGTKNKTLWDRLGGEAGVTKIVDDFVNLAAPDPKVDFFRGGKYKLTAEEVAKMKRELVEQISQATGGPLRYTGPDMKEVHKGMGITNAQFNAAAADLKKALEKNKVAAEDVQKILAAVGSYRKEIVQPKKPEEKKPEDKKPTKKKPEDKKPKDKKPADITGKVTYKGKSLTGGIITFRGDKISSSVGIHEDGTYLLKVKTGTYRVAVTTPAVPGVKPPPPVVKPPAKLKNVRKFVKIPAKYSDPDTSGLTYTVKDGRQTFDIDLK